MKIAIISTSDKVGGAAIAAFRLFKALNKFNAYEDSIEMVVAEKANRDEANVFEINFNWLLRKIGYIKFAVEYLIANKLLRNLDVSANYSPGFWGNSIRNHTAVKNADVLNIHWINNSFLSLKDINDLVVSQKPIVWHLHDMWLFTGGCHYAGSCTKFTTSCSNCPVLKYSNDSDLSKSQFDEKAKMFRNANLTIVTPSKWLADLAASSTLLKSKKVLHIPNPIDANIYGIRNKAKSKIELGLNENVRYILFGAMNTNDERKGFAYLKRALRLLDASDIKYKNVELLSFGKMLKDDTKHDFGFKLNELGSVSDTNKIIDIYNAAEIFVIPSLEDNLPNTVLEAMACGVPVVGFETGGIPEMVKQNKTGYIAKYKDAQDLANGIETVLFHKDYNLMCENARQIVLQEYSEEVVAKAYYKLFDSLVEA